MATSIKELNPQIIWKNFYLLTQVPRPSGHLQKIQQFLLDWAKEHGIEAFKDGAGSRKKLKEWKRQLIYCGKGDLLDKTVEFCVPEDELLKGDYGFEELLSGRLGKYIEERGNKIY